MDCGAAPPDVDAVCPAVAPALCRRSLAESEFTAVVSGLSVDSERRSVRSSPLDSLAPLDVPSAAELCAPLSFDCASRRPRPRRPRRPEGASVGACSLLASLPGLVSAVAAFSCSGAAAGFASDWAPSVPSTAPSAPPSIEFEDSAFRLPRRPRPPRRPRRLPERLRDERAPSSEAPCSVVCASVVACSFVNAWSSACLTSLAEVLSLERLPPLRRPSSLPLLAAFP